MKILAALSLIVFGILLTLFITLQVYQVPFIQNPSVEQWRQRIDSQLKQTFVTLRHPWINAVIFHNKDKYIWYPPRIQFAYNENSIIGYKVYGMVVSWDYEAKLLTLSSYLGKPLYVRFLPTSNGPIAILPKFDMFGYVTSSEVQAVQRINVPNWNTLFCSYDIVSVDAKSYMSFFQSSKEKPLIPTVITLSYRLCKQ
jgi:hypothetical protein